MNGSKMQIIDFIFDNTLPVTPCEVLYEKKRKMGWYVQIDQNLNISRGVYKIKRYAE